MKHSDIIYSTVCRYSMRHNRRRVILQKGDPKNCFVGEKIIFFQLLFPLKLLLDSPVNIYKKHKYFMINTLFSVKINTRLLLSFLHLQMLSSKSNLYCISRYILSFHKPCLLKGVCVHLSRLLNNSVKSLHNSTGQLDGNTGFVF